MSPFANPFRQLGQVPTAQPRPANPFMNMGIMSMMGGRPTISQDTPDPMPMRPQISMTQGPEPAQLGRVPLSYFNQGPTASVLSQPANPFEGNEQYQDQRAQMQSLMEAMQPSQEQRDRLGELRTAFENTGGFKDYRINQMEQQMQRMRQPRMGMGLGSQRPMGMGMFGGFPQVPQRQPQGIMGGFGQQPMPVPRGGYNQYQQMPQPQYQPYQNPYQQQRPQPQQYGGYGMGQQMGGYGNYGGMQNPYQPQQYGNPNNFMGYQQPQQQYNQPAVMF